VEMEEKMIDNQDRKDKALRQSRAYLESLFKYANAPIIVWNPDFRITRFNRAFEQLSGYSANEMIGRSLPFLFPEARSDESLRKIERTLAGEYWDSVEIPILKKDGEIRVALWNSANIFADDGRTIVATIAQGQDITDRKRAEEELRQCISRLEKTVEKRTAELTRTNQNLIQEIDQREEAEKALKQSESKLRERKEALEEKNIALREILEQIEIEKKQIKDNVIANVENILLPIVRKLKGRDSQVDSENVDLLERELREVTSRFGRRLSDPRLMLTPREIEICDLIKNGLGSKKIARVLWISLKTVERHRFNIRKKLDIAYRKINLTSYLQNI